MRPAVAVKEATARVLALGADIKTWQVTLQCGSHRDQVGLDTRLHAPDGLAHVNYREKLPHIDRPLPYILCIQMHQGGFCQWEPGSADHMVLNSDIVQVVLLEACRALYLKELWFYRILWFRRSLL